MRKKPLPDEMSLKEIRKYAGLTQQKLAEEIGIGFSSLSHYEKQTAKPSLEVFVKLCESLEVSPRVLLKALGFDVTNIPKDEDNSSA